MLHLGLYTLVMVFINYQSSTLKMLSLDPIVNVWEAHTALHILIFSSAFHFDLISLFNPTDCTKLCLSPIYSGLLFSV